MNKFLVFLSIFFLFSFFSFAENFTLTINDLRLEPVFNFAEAEPVLEGYNLYIRKLPQVESVMLTETTKDPLGLEANYAYRALQWNSTNGNENRMLDGKVLQSEYSKFSILDSSVQNDKSFGEAFLLFIPTTMVYGYPWTRNGKVSIGPGTFINIRCFGAKFADYSKGFGDNPFMFDLDKSPTKNEVKNQKVTLTDSYNPSAAASFEAIAKNSSGNLIFSQGPDSLVNDIIASLNCMDFSKPVDLVLAIDATGSMKDDIEKLREELTEKLVELVNSKQGQFRIGLLLYRDYSDGFRHNGLPVKVFPFTQDFSEFEKQLNSFTIRGTEGGDIPEAVYEALFASIEFYKWNPFANKKIILIGDAEAHPRPRGTGKYTKELVASTALSLDIAIDTIITPDGKTSADRKAK